MPNLTKAYFRAWHLEADPADAAAKPPAKIRKARMPRWPSRRHRARPPVYRL